MKKRRRKLQRPVLNENGELVTPVSGEPAAKINWAPPCPVCQTRTCGDCGEEVRHSNQTCVHCGGDNLSDPHRGLNTYSPGNRPSKVGTCQKLKCRSCGHSWTRIIKAPAS